ncbi:hypothetical protein NQZ68_016400 [Dissostichus eleginoides]|nr:hypothetical protein NQZ68_016400 [Dissostichus eleginoides]
MPRGPDVSQLFRVNSAPAAEGHGVASPTGPSLHDGALSLRRCQVAAGRESPQPGFSSPHSGPLATTVATRGSTPALLTCRSVMIRLQWPVCPNM